MIKFVLINLMFLSLLFNSVVIYQGERLKNNIYDVLLLFEIAVLVTMHEFWHMVSLPFAMIMAFWILTIDYFYKYQED